MIACQVCSAKTATTWLCTRHDAELRANLAALAGTLEDGRAHPGWIENLHDASIGQTRMGGVGSRRGENDDAPIRFNTKASDLLTQVHAVLARWVQDLTESRGVSYVPVRFVRPNLYGPLEMGTVRGLRYIEHGAVLALWLEMHADSIVASEDAGLCFEEIEQAIAAIMRLIDRPEEKRQLGCCTTVMDDGKECAYYLTAAKEAIEVTCPNCHTTRNVEKVIETSLSRADHMAWTATAIMQHITTYGLELNERTWQHWRKTGVVKPCLYQRANDRRRIGINRQHPDDVPLYRLSDVRQAIATKGKHREKGKVKA